MPDMKPSLKASAHRAVGEHVVPTMVAKHLGNGRQTLACIYSRSFLARCQWAGA
jgi:hypothetical protein